MKMGGADQQFCLRWNNFHTNITNAFESLRDDEDFVDITLACEGRQVRAHKMVLSACSPYFRNLLKGNPCQHPIVFLKDVTFANLASILDFMYHGEVNVSHNELATFLKTAEALRVRGLAEDDKKKDHENSTDANSPGPSKDPPDPGSPPSSRLTEDHANNAASPPSKRRRRRSASPPGGTQSSNDEQQGPLDPLETSRDVKNEPLEDDFSAEDHHHQSDLLGADPGNPGPGLKMDGCDEVEDRLGFALSDSVSVTRNQAAMQQLQDSFPAFLPAITQPSAFLSHNAGGSGGGDAQRGSYSMDAVQGLPPGMSTMAGPSMSQASASQDSSSQGGADRGGAKANYKSGGATRSGRQPVFVARDTAGGGDAASTSLLPAAARSGQIDVGFELFDGAGEKLKCPYCFKLLRSLPGLRTHIRDQHSGNTQVVCSICLKVYRNQNSLSNHMSLYHKGVSDSAPRLTT